MQGQDYLAFKRRRVAFLPSSRLEEGLIPGLTISDHVALGMKTPSFIFAQKKIQDGAAHRIQKFQIKGTPEIPVDALSGGNQQRLLLSLLPEKPKLLLLENPTRGLDLESANWIWQQLHDLCTSGTTVIFSSSIPKKSMRSFLVAFEKLMMWSARSADFLKA